MARRTWPGTFHRASIAFPPGVPVILDDTQLAAVKGDIGKALEYCQVLESGQPIGKPAKDQEHPSAITQAPEAAASESARTGRRGRGR